MKTSKEEKIEAIMNIFVVEEDIRIEDEKQYVRCDVMRKKLSEAIDWATQQTLQRVEEMIPEERKHAFKVIDLEDIQNESFNECRSQLLSKLKEMKSNDN